MLNEPVPVSEPAAPGHAFDLLEGAWSGEGTGEYPTIDTFHYREMLTFERRSETSLFYVQRTEKFLEGQAEPVTSHWESGFIEAPEEGELQLANVQIGGRGEVLTGYIERAGHSIKLVFKSQSLSNDTRMVATSRIFELEGDTLRYEQAMATTRVVEVTRHVYATLFRTAV